MTLIEELRTNRESGAKRLEAEYKAGLIILARRLYPDHGDAEELVNRTFAEVVEGIDGFLEQSSLFTWMCRILNNLYLMDRRRKSNENIVYPGVVPEIADEEAHEAIYTNLDVSLLRDAIETLPKEMKEAIMLHYIAEQPISVAARFLRLPVSTVKWRLHVARRELARRLGATVGDAAKKPGVKAMLVALALAAITAAGAATTLAVARLLSPPRAAQGQQAYNSKDATAQGQQAYNGKGAAAPTDSSFQTTPKEQSMNTATRTAALGAATALALAAAPPAVTADSSPNRGASSWDGESWVYDTSLHVAAQPSTGASPSVALAASRDSGASAEGPLDAVFMTRQMSNGFPINGAAPGFSVIVR